MSYTVCAQDNSWTNPASGKWETPSNWSQGAPALAQSTLSITNASAKTVSMDGTTAANPSVLTISNLTIAGGSGATNTLSISMGSTSAVLHILNGFTVKGGGAVFITNSTLEADLAVSTRTNRIDGLLTVASGGSYLTTNANTFIGTTNGANGVINIMGGTVVMPALVVGVVTNGTGQVTMAGGSLTVTNNSVTIGSFGSGQILVSNGLFTTRSLTVGRNPGAPGIFSGTANSTNNIGLLFVVGTGVGSTGQVWITGGSLLTNTTGGATLGQAGTATLDVTNSTVCLNGMTIGSGIGSRGTATFVGSAVTLNGNLVIGGTTAATGAVMAVGGQLTVTNGVYVGFLGDGRLTVSNGSLKAASLLVSVESSGGTLTMLNATATVANGASIGYLGGPGTVWMTGSSLITTNAAVYLGYNSTGQIILSNSTLLASNLTVGAFFLSQGGVTVAGGTSTVSSSVIVGDVGSNGVGQITINNGVFAVTNATHTAVLNVLNGTVTVNGGTLLVDNLVMTNNYGRFSHTGGTVTVHTMTLDPNLSASGDALPNWWKQQYGLDPLSSNGVNGINGDPDGDGMSNSQEYFMGTNPTNGASALRVVSLTRIGNDMLVTWTTRSGHANVVQAAAGLGGSYSNISPSITIVGNGDVITNYLDVGGATNIPSRFYRVALVQPAVDHFAFSFIGGPQTSGVPFTVTITALDATNGVLTGFSSTAALSLTGSVNGVFISPQTSALFTAGQLTVPITVSAFTEATVAIVATDGSGHTGQSNPFGVVRLSSNVLIPVINTPADIVADSARGLLYMTVSNQVQRYDLVNGVFLTPFNLGGNLRGIDISPDNNTLVVADASFSGSSNWVDVIDLPTGVSRQATFPLAFAEAGTWAVAFGNDGAVLITSEFQGSGWTPMRRYDPVTGNVTTVAAPRQHSMISSSGDGRLIAVAESNSSPAPFDRYNVASQQIVGNTSLGSFLFEAAANRDGSQFAALASTGTYLLNSNFTQGVTVPTSIGAAYHPQADMGFFAVASTSYVLALETHTLAEITRFDCGSAFFSAPGTFTLAFQYGRVRISRDGNNVFVTVGNGVRWISRGTGLPADLGLGLIGSANPIRLGSNLTYSITVTNNGPNGVSDAKVFDLLPASAAFVSATASQGTCTLSNGVVIGTLGTMASGNVASVSIVVGTPTQRIFTNVAVITSSAADPNLLNNTATVATSVQSSIPPLLNITSPTDNSYTTNSTVTVIGTSTSPSGVTSVTVNGNAASTANGYTNWMAVVSGLAAGTNTVVVTATDNYVPPDVATNFTHVIYATGAYDGNGDGLPDLWQIQYFGCVSCPQAAPGNDRDGDGLSNLQEFLAGTDPTNSASLFRITSVISTGSSVLVTWMTGSGKTNALQWTDGADDGSYATDNFADIFVVTNTVGTTTNYLDAGIATNSPARYYRVRLVP